ncbi:MAG TPA: glycosyltransferase family 2 protein, partial [Geminicoccaceae bacterium]|nr:glycosyltransferase family 2 protein [Geminicoccaceae bacterium]
ELDRLAERHGGTLPLEAHPELAELAMCHFAFAEAVGLYRAALAAAPERLWVRAGLARALAADGRRDEAERLLLEVEAPPRRPALLRALLDVAVQVEDLRGMARWALRLVRAPEGRGLAAPRLVEALVGLGHERLAERLVRGRLRRLCSGHELALCRFMLDHARARYPEALDALAAAPPGAAGDDQGLFLARYRQRALLRAGRLREALALTAEAAIPPRLGAAEIRRRQGELRRFLRTPEARAAAPRPEHLAHYRTLLCAVHEAATASDLVKRVPADPRFARFMRGLHERRGEPAALLRWVEAELPPVRAQVRLGVLMGLPLHYAHEALWQLGERGRALERLRGALMYLHPEPYFHATYRARYRALAPPLRLAGPDRVVSLILSCRRNLAAARLLAAQLEEHALPCLILIAEPGLAVPELAGNLLTVPGADSYEALPNKIARAWEYLALASNCRGVLKIDEDVYVEDFRRFAQMVAALGRGAADHVGRCLEFSDPVYHFGKCGDDGVAGEPALHGRVRYCDGGRGYYLSRRALRRFAEIVVHFPRYLATARYEDVMVAEVLRAAGIAPTHASLEYLGAMRADSFEGVEHLFGAAGDDGAAGPEAAAPTATALAAAARAAQEQGDRERAVALWEDCLARFPEDPERRWWLAMQGYALLETGATEAAGRAFAALVRAFPEEPEGHAGLAYLAERRWRWGAAIEHWDRCLALAAPAARPARLARKALCLAETGEVGPAAALLEEALGTGPPQIETLEARARLAELQGPPALARQRWDECIRHCPEEIRGWLGKARHLGGIWAFDEAMALLEDAIGRWPDVPAPRVLRASLAVAMRQWPLAERLWQETLRQFPDDPEALLGHLGHLGARGRGAEGARLARARTPPGRLRTRCLLELAVAGRDLDAALGCLGELILAEPDDPALGLREAELRGWRLAPGDLERAVQILERLLAGAPDSVTIKARLIEALVRCGARARALALLATVPAQDRRREVAALRAWRSHLQGDEAAAKLAWRDILERAFFPAVHAPVGELRRIDRRAGPVGREEVVLLSVLRNELPRLAWFLDHYRRLGVGRFVLVDNGSDDGTTELLEAAPDVVLYRTEDSYALAAYGVRWLNRLLESHDGAGWWLHVDADEALVFPGSERRGLRDLVRHLAGKGHEAMFAVMLDMFPERLDGAGGRYDWFDPPPAVREAPVCPYREVSGGARQRLFGRGVFMGKTPLIRGGAGIRFLMSSHHTTPAIVSDVTGALLHHHLDYLLDERHRPRLRDEVERGEHSDHAVDRARYLDLLPGLAARGDLRGPESIRFVSTRQLVELGILRTSPDFG